MCGHRAKGAARGTAGAGRSEHRRIESIIRFAADLQVQSFPQLRVLEQRQIELTDAISAYAAEEAAEGNQVIGELLAGSSVEARRVEPFADASLIAGKRNLARRASEKGVPKPQRRPALESEHTRSEEHTSELQSLR